MSEQLITINEEERIDEKEEAKKLYADLKDAVGYIQDLTSFLPIPLCMVNHAQKIIDVNIAFLSLVGYKQHEVIGKKIDILLKDQQDAVQLMRNIEKEGFIKNYKTSIFTKEKKEIPITLFSSLRKDNDGNILSYFFTFIDTTEIYQIEKSLTEKVETLKQNKLAMLNMMEDMQDTVATLKKTEKELEKKNEELQMQTEELAVVNTSMIAMNEELSRTQEDLKKFNEELEQRVRDRTAEVEELLKQKDEFVGQLGHDLKTPLTPLITLLPIIRKREQDPKLVELLDVTIQNVNYMKNLVVKTLQLAQLNSPNVSFEMIDFPLSAEIKTAIEHNQNNFEKTGIIVESNLDDSIIVTADPLQIKELIDNLLSNAIKFTLPGGKITISTVQQQDSVITTIQDTGIGLTVEQLEHLFEEFYKADPSRHDLESTGLGLVICKRIVEKHGGKIWAESLGPGKGATFHFTMKIGHNNLVKHQQDSLCEAMGEKKE